MGGDIIGWRACPLQHGEGEDAFFHKLKLLAYKRAVDGLVLEERRADVPVKIRVGGQPDRVLAYRAIVEELGDFAAGIPACDACPLAEGRRLGCYRYLTFPIPAEIEESLTAFAERQLGREGAPLRVLAESYRLDTQHRALSDGFRWSRGTSPGHLATRPAPLAIEVAPFTDLDSADLLSILIPPFREAEELALEAEVLEAWLAEQPVDAAPWPEWQAFAHLLRAATELSRSVPEVAVLFDA